VLESIFGEAYLSYKRRTPRWLPRPPAAPGARGEFFWGEAWKSEISTFLQFVAIIALLLVKERFL